MMMSGEAWEGGPTRSSVPRAASAKRYRRPRSVATSTIQRKALPRQISRTSNAPRPLGVMRASQPRQPDVSGSRKASQLVAALTVPLRQTWVSEVLPEWAADQQESHHPRVPCDGTRLAASFPQPQFFRVDTRSEERRVGK